MTEDQTNTVLKPSLPRAFLHMFLLLLVTTAIAAAAERYRNGHWWDAEYIISLAVPLLLMPAFVCLMFVPRRIRWSAGEFQIQPRFGRPRTLPWTQLHAYGNGPGVFLLQFNGVRTFQIYTSALSRAGWRSFRLFLATNHPDKKTLLWFGPNAIRRNPDA